MASLLTHLALFAIAFLAATILPLQSEAVLSGLLIAGREPWATLLAVAAAGNTAGAVVNWYMGKMAVRLQGTRWFPVTQAQLARAEGWYRRYGRWCLLGSWLPVVGDALTVAAGVLHEKFWIFVVLVGIGKTARYLALAAAISGLW